MPDDIKDTNKLDNNESNKNNLDSETTKEALNVPSTEGTPEVTDATVNEVAKDTTAGVPGEGVPSEPAKVADEILGNADQELIKEVDQTEEPEEADYVSSINEVTFDDLFKQYLINQDLAEEVGDKLVLKKAPRKSKAPIIILSIALILAVMVIGIQASFLWRFSVGEMEKVSSPVEKYIQANKKEKTEEISSAVNPNFSLEEAASVSDPNKKALSTVEIYDKVYPATVTIYVKGMQDGVEAVTGAGSGFIITEDGYIVTNEHVVDGAETGIEVVVPNYEKTFDAELVGVDKQTDIAVLKITSEKPFPIVTLGNSDNLQNGEMAVAIGSPLGSFEGTITVGVVSGVERPMNNNGYAMNLIQTDASVNSGNSGGALINSFGEVIGVVNAKIPSAEGLGFAIPIDSVKGIIESIIVNGKVINRPYLGITVMYVAPNSYFGAVEGVFVNDYMVDGPGDQAGIKVGDRLVSMDGVEIKESNDIILVRDSHSCGDEITVIVERDGENVELTLVIGDSADYDE